MCLVAGSGDLAPELRHFRRRGGAEAGGGMRVERLGRARGRVVEWRAACEHAPLSCEPPCSAAALGSGCQGVAGHTLSIPSPH
eukprot:362206-Chlamydomonas_euryale.AAC.6